MDEARCAQFGAAVLKQFVLFQAREVRVGHALEAVEKRGDHGPVGDLDTWNESRRLGQVQRAVVNEQDRLRPELHGFDQCRQARPFAPQWMLGKTK